MVEIGSENYVSNLLKTPRVRLIVVIVVVVAVVAAFGPCRREVGGVSVADLSRLLNASCGIDRSSPVVARSAASPQPTSVGY